MDQFSRDVAVALDDQLGAVLFWFTVFVPGLVLVFALCLVVFFYVWKTGKKAAKLQSREELIEAQEKKRRDSSEEEELEKQDTVQSESSGELQNKLRYRFIDHIEDTITFRKLEKSPQRSVPYFAISAFMRLLMMVFLGVGIASFYYIYLYFVRHSGFTVLVVISFVCIFSMLAFMLVVYLLWRRYRKHYCKNHKLAIALGGLFLSYKKSYDIDSLSFSPYLSVDHPDRW